MDNLQMLANTRTGTAAAAGTFAAVRPTFSETRPHAASTGGARRGQLAGAGGQTTSSSDPLSETDFGEHQSPLQSLAAKYAAAEERLYDVPDDLQEGAAEEDDDDSSVSGFEEDAAGGAGHRSAEPNLLLALVEERRRRDVSDDDGSDSASEDD